LLDRIGDSEKDARFSSNHWNSFHFHKHLASVTPKPVTRYDELLGKSPKIGMLIKLEKIPLPI
jgi:hypothetical protein